MVTPNPTTFWSCLVVARDAGFGDQAEHGFSDVAGFDDLPCRAAAEPGSLQGGIDDFGVECARS
jgi:hypothetical protein